MRLKFNFLPLENHELNWLAHILVTEETSLDDISPGIGIEFMKAVKSEIEDRQLERRGKCIIDISFEGPVDQWADQVYKAAAWCILLAEDRDQHADYRNVASLLSDMANQLTDHIGELTRIRRGTGKALDDNSTNYTGGKYWHGNTIHPGSTETHTPVSRREPRNDS